MESTEFPGVLMESVEFLQTPHGILMESMEFPWSPCGILRESMEFLRTPTDYIGLHEKSMDSSWIP
jgi:hypothetical protein